MRLTRRSFDALPVLNKQSSEHPDRDGEEATRRTCKLQDFGREIFKDGRGVHRGFRADADIVLRALLQVSVNSANRKL